MKKLSYMSFQKPILQKSIHTHTHIYTYLFISTRDLFSFASDVCVESMGKCRLREH